MALELLLLCMRMLYFCMAAEKVGALVRMVLIVIKVGTNRDCLSTAWHSRECRSIAQHITAKELAAAPRLQLQYTVHRPCHCKYTVAQQCCFCCVLQDMRYFFLMLVFLLVSFGLTFSVLMSPVSSEKLNLVSLVTDTNGQVANSEVQVFGSLEVRAEQSWLHAIMHKE